MSKAFLLLILAFSLKANTLNVGVGSDSVSVLLQGDIGPSSVTSFDYSAQIYVPGSGMGTIKLFSNGYGSDRAGVSGIVSVSLAGLTASCWGDSFQCLEPGQTADIALGQTYLLTVTGGIRTDAGTSGQISLNATFDFLQNGQPIDPQIQAAVPEPRTWMLTLVALTMAGVSYVFMRSMK